MKQIPMLANVVASTSLERPELLVKPRPDLAARLGVSTEGLSETLRIATIGDVGPALAKFDAGDRLVPIRAQLDAKARTNLQVLENIRVPTGLGSSVPLAHDRQYRAWPGRSQHQSLRPRAPSRDTG